MSEEQGTPGAPVLSMEQIKAEAKEGVGPKEEAPKGPIFNANFGDDGVLRMELDLKPCIASEEKRLILHGFMLQKIDEAMDVIERSRAAIADQKMKITKVNQHGISGFLRKMGRA